MNEYESEEREVDLLEYWKVIVKRKWVIATFTGALVFFVGIFSFLATPIYKATTTLLVEEESSRMLSMEDTFGYQSQVYRDLRSFNTQLKLLRSKSLTERVAKKMNLRSRSEYGAGKENQKSLLAGAKDILSLKWIGAKKKDGDNNNPRVRKDPYSDITKSVQESIVVSPIRETKLVEVSFSSTSPVLATDIVNTLAREFIEFTVEKRYQYTQQASDFLTDQIANLRDEIANKERELQKYSESKGLLFTGDKANAVVKAFGDLNTAFTTAQLDRYKKEAKYLELKDLRVDNIPQYIDAPGVQTLRGDYIRTRSEYNEKSKQYLPDYPEMIALKGKLDSLKADLQDELRKAIEAARLEFNEAMKNEDSIGKALNRQRQEVRRTNNNAILYNSLEIELKNLRNTLNSLEERQSQTQVSARLGGLKTSNITIIDEAEVPESPVSPKKKMNLILALLIGLFGGVGLCFVLEYLDNTVKGPEDVEKLSGLPSLGIIPYLPPEGMSKKQRHGYYSYRSKYIGLSDSGDSEGVETQPEVTEIDLVNLHHPSFFISEDYRTVRTSILLSHADGPPKTISFTSALPSEGKTTSAANLAVAFAQLDQNVLIIDADLRKPRMHKIFKTRNVVGLSAYLTGKIPIEEAIVETETENICIIPSGPIPPNPTELLNSKKMKELMTAVHHKYDIVMIDTLPIMAVVDPVIVASLVDATILVVKAGSTTEKPFVQAVEQLNRAKAQIIGVLFNETKMTREGYYSQGYKYKYRYHYYKYGGGEGEAREKGGFASEKREKR